MKENKDVPVSVRITESTMHKLRIVAAHDRSSINRSVNMALNSYLGDYLVRFPELLELIIVPPNTEQTP